MIWLHCHSWWRIKPYIAHLRFAKKIKMCEVTACFLFIYSVLFDSQNVLLPKLSTSNLDSFENTIFTTSTLITWLPHCWLNSTSLHIDQLSNTCPCHVEFFTSSLAIRRVPNGTFQKLLFHPSSPWASPVFLDQLVELIKARHALITPPTIFGGPIIVTCVLSSERLGSGFLSLWPRLNTLIIFLFLFVFVFISSCCSSLLSSILPYFFPFTNVVFVHQ